MHVGDHRLGRLAAEAGARTRRQRLQLGDHFGHVLGVDAAELAQARQIALRQQVEVIEQAGHGRVEAVALDQLQLQALRNGASHDPGRLEAVANGQDGLDAGGLDAQPVGDLGQIAAQVAALVDHVDQGQGDGVIGGRQTCLRRLRLQVLPQGGVAGVRLFASLAVREAAAGAGAGPVRQAGLGLVGHAVRGALARGGVAIDVVGARIDGVGGVGGATVLEAHLGAVAGLRRFGQGVGGLARLGVLALQQRVALQLGFHEGLELEVGQLQQLDGLLQLGRDDQPLPLPDLQPLPEHCSTPAGPGGPKLAGGHPVAGTVNGV